MHLLVAVSKSSPSTKVQQGCWSCQKFFSVFMHQSEQREEWVHFSRIRIASNRNPDLEFVFAFQEHPWAVCGDSTKMLINTTVNENKHGLKFQALWLLLKASRDSNRCNKAEVHFGCQGIMFPTSDSSSAGENIPPIAEQVVTFKRLCVWKAISEMQQTWMGGFPAPAKGHLLTCMGPGYCSGVSSSAFSTCVFISLIWPKELQGWKKISSSVPSQLLVLIHSILVTLSELNN